MVPIAPSQPAASKPTHSDEQNIRTCRRPEVPMG